jgi:Mg/Co/Ni transporter MgtE
MGFWLLAGILTAFITGLIVAPLRKETPVLGALLIFLIPLCALGLYFLVGNPELAK